MNTADRIRPQWVLVANTVQARVLSRFDDQRLDLVRHFTHPAGRPPAHGHEPQDHEQQARQHERFAAELAAYLDSHARSGAFERLAIFAPAGFAAVLKRQLGPDASGRLLGVYPVDLSRFSQAEVELRIGPLLLHSRPL